MKFLVDAQLPKRLAQRLQAAGYDTLHTLDLPEQNRTAIVTALTTSVFVEMNRNSLIVHGS